MKQKRTFIGIFMLVAWATVEFATTAGLEPSDIDAVKNFGFRTITTQSEKLATQEALTKSTQIKVGEAIKTMGLGKLLAANPRITPKQLETLASDETAFVAHSGEIYFADPAPINTDSSRTQIARDQVLESGITSDQAFSLQSRVGSEHTIFLDFNSFRVQNTPWNGNFGLSKEYTDTTPYDEDGDPTTFSEAERSTIISVWLQVSQAYSPFDVNVTTMDLGPDATRRDDWIDTKYGSHVVFYGNEEFGQLCGCGGVAFMHSFGLPYLWGSGSPTWVVATNKDPFWLAGVAEHEVGHTFGLSHDNTSTQEYYLGNGLWGPIMGGGADDMMEQWNNGDYADAQNWENDTQTISDYGAPLLPDDFGDSAESEFAIEDKKINVTGIITTRQDKDYFGFDTAGGELHLDVQGAIGNRSLDLAMTLLDSRGDIVEIANPASVVNVDPTTGQKSLSGLDATITRDLPAGHYSVFIEGIGQGDWTSGYSDYGSLGKYTLTGSVASKALGEPQIGGLSSDKVTTQDSFEVTGVNLGSPVLVEINGTPCVFKIINDHELSVVVPEDASTGYVRVATDFGTAVSTRKILVMKQNGSGNLTLSIPNETLRVGDTAVAEVSDWSPETTFRFAWFADGIHVANNFSSRIVIDSSLAGKTLTLQAVAFRMGYKDISMSAKEQFAIYGPFLQDASVPRITGDLLVGKALSVVDANLVPKAETATYEWHLALKQVDTIIATDATGAMVIPNEAAGGRIWVTVTYHHRSVPDLTLTSSAAGLVTGGQLSVASKKLIDSTSTKNRVGDTLELDVAAISPAPDTLDVTWLRDGIPIWGMPNIYSLGNTNYQLAADDIGHKVTAQVIARRRYFDTLVYTTDADENFQLGIFGYPKVQLNNLLPTNGSYLSFGLSESFGVGGAPIDPNDVRIDWVRDDAKVVSHDPEILLTTVDVGHTFFARVTVIKPGYEQQVEVTQTTQQVEMRRLSGSVSIDGDLQVGKTLQSVFTTSGDAPTSITYQWRCYKNSLNVIRSTDATYQLTEADAGCFVYLETFVSRSNYQTSNWSSLMLQQPVAPGPWVAEAPRIQGQYWVGSTLSSVAGAVTVPSDYHIDQLVWLRDGTEVSAEATYKLTAADVGHQIELRQKMSSTTYGSKVLKSGSVVVSATNLPTPNLIAILGSPQVGNTLTPSVPAWDDLPGIKLSYHWVRNNIEVGSQSTYLLTANDVGSQISFRVEATVLGFQPASATTGPCAQVLANPAPPLPPSPTPTATTGNLKISGKLKVGSTLTVSLSGGTQGAKLSYVWIRNGIAIAGAKGKAYKLTAKDRGAKLTVAVTAKRPGYKSSTTTLKLSKVG